MTTTTETTTLKAGDRVEFRGHRATLAEPKAEDSLPTYWVLRFDDGDAPSFAWDGEAPHRGYGPGRFYFVRKNSDELSHVEPETYVPQLGDKVTVTEAGHTYTGAVYGLQTSRGSDTVAYVWMGSASMPYSGAYGFGGVSAYRDRRLVPREDVPEDVRGWWFCAEDVRPAEPTGITPATAPSEPANVTQLQARLENSEATVQRLREQISAMERDVQTIGEHLKATAQRSEWCDEYERHLNRLLAELSSYTEDTLREAATRTRTYRVTFTYTTTVEAANEDEAEEYASECWSTGDLDGSWEAEED